MKKILVLLLTIVLVFSFSACKNKENINNDPENDNQNYKIVFQEFTAVDNENCSIIIKEILPENRFGIGLKVECINKSKDKAYQFYIQSASINKVQCNPYGSVRVTANQKEDFELYFPATELIENGIGSFTDIEVTFLVYDSDDEFGQPIVLETVHIYPYGQDKASQYVREAKPNDQIIINNQYITVTVIGYDPQGLDGYTVSLFMTNKTQYTLMYSIEEASINGYPAQLYYATTIDGGNSMFGSFYFINDLLKEYGIEKIETIELKFRAFDIEASDGTDYTNEVVVLKP